MIKVPFYIGSQDGFLKNKFKFSHMLFFYLLVICDILLQSANVVNDKYWFSNVKQNTEITFLE